MIDVVLAQPLRLSGAQLCPWHLVIHAVCLRRSYQRLRENLADSATSGRCEDIVGSFLDTFVLLFSTNSLETKKSNSAKVFAFLNVKSFLGKHSAARKEGRGKRKISKGLAFALRLCRRRKGQRPDRSTKLRVNPARQMSRSCKSCSPADGNATRPHRRGFRHQLSSLMNFRDEFLRPEAVWPAASYRSHGHRWWHWQLALLQNTEPSDGSGQSLDKRIIWRFLLQKWKKGKHVANKEKSAIVLVLSQRAGM